MLHPSAWLRVQIRKLFYYVIFVDPFLSLPHRFKPPSGVTSEKMVLMCVKKAEADACKSVDLMESLVTSSPRRSAHVTSTPSADPHRALLLIPQTRYLTCVMYKYSRPYTCTASRYRSFSIVTRTTGVRFPVDIYYRHYIQTGCGALTAFRYICTGGFDPRDKAARE
jgi:hypothetical protein